MRHLTAATLLLLAAGCDRSSVAPRAAPAASNLPALSTPAVATDASGTPASTAPAKPGGSPTSGAPGATRPVGKDDSHWVDVDESDPVLAELHARQAQRDRELLKQDTDEAASSGRNPGPNRRDQQQPGYDEQSPRYEAPQSRYDQQAQDELPPSDEMPPDEMPPEDMPPSDEMPPEDMPPDEGPPPDYYDDVRQAEPPPPYEEDPYDGGYDH